MRFFILLSLLLLVAISNARGAPTEEHPEIVGEDRDDNECGGKSDAECDGICILVNRGDCQLNEALFEEEGRRALEQNGRVNGVEGAGSAAQTDENAEEEENTNTEEEENTNEDPCPEGDELCWQKLEEGVRGNGDEPTEDHSGKPRRRKL